MENKNATDNVSEYKKQFQVELVDGYVLRGEILIGLESMYSDKLDISFIVLGIDHPTGAEMFDSELKRVKNPLIESLKIKHPEIYKVMTTEGFEE